MEKTDDTQIALQTFKQTVIRRGDTSEYEHHFLIDLKNIIDI